jgi:hypothetical protein
MCLEDRPVLEPNAAGIDVGAREMFVAVPPGRDENPVRVFATFTEDLERLTDWLEHQKSWRRIAELWKPNCIVTAICPEELWLGYSRTTRLRPPIRACFVT